MEPIPGLDLQKNIGTTGQPQINEAHQTGQTQAGVDILNAPVATAVIQNEQVLKPEATDVEDESKFNKRVTETTEFVMKGITAAGNLLTKGLKGGVKYGVGVPIAAGITAGEVAVGATVGAAVIAGTAAVEAGKAVYEAGKVGYERVSEVVKAGIERSAERFAKLKKDTKKLYTATVDGINETVLVFGSGAVKAGAWLSKVGESAVQPAADLFAKAAQLDSRMSGFLETQYKGAAKGIKGVSENIYSGVASAGTRFAEGMMGVDIGKGRAKLPEKKAQRVLSKLEKQGFMGKIASKALGLGSDFAGWLGGIGNEVKDSGNESAANKREFKKRSSNYKRWIPQLAKTSGSGALTKLSDELLGKAQNIADKYGRAIMEDNK